MNCPSCGRETTPYQLRKAGMCKTCVRTEKPKWTIKPCGCPENWAEEHQEGCGLA